MNTNQFISKPMKKIKSIIISVIAMVILLTTSCQDLTEINKSPNQLNASDINIKYVLTKVLSYSSWDYIRGQVYGGGTGITEAMQYLQRDYIDYSGPNTFTWGTQDFKSFNVSLINSEYIVNNAKTELLEGNQKFYQAVGQIMRSFWYGFFTSAWGDIPYSEAMKGTEGNFTPVYDDQKAIFKGILADLKSANEILATVTSVDGASSIDIMYAGDILKWRKFANSLRLRFLLRLSEKLSDMSALGVDVKSEFSTMVGNSSTYPIFTANSDNAAISYIGDNSSNGWYGGPLSWSNRSEYYRRKPCATFVNSLRDNGDPRLTTFIRPVDVQLKISTTKTGYTKLSDGQIVLYLSPAQVGTTTIDTARYVGLPPAMGAPDLYNFSSLTNFNTIKSLNSGIYVDQAANPNVSYLADIYAKDSNPLVKSVFMSYSELCFILAEARLKGWFTSGTAIDYYQAGIVASLSQYNIANGSTSVYNTKTHALTVFSQSAFLADLNTKFTSAASDDVRLSQLMTQKWIATFMTPEFWFDWRRTGMPNFGANLISGSNGTKIPVRYAYGAEDVVLNSTNMNAAVAKLSPATNDHWSKMWLLQGTNKPW